MRPLETARYIGVALRRHRAALNAQAEYRFAVRNRLLIVAIFLVVGAAVNVAVAWGFSILTESAQFDALLTARIRRQHFEAIERPDRLESEAPWVEGAFRGAGVVVVVIRPPGEGLIRLHRAGWPARALEGRESIPASGDPSYRWGMPISDKVSLALEYHRGAATPIVKTVTKVLPVRPIWRGFLLNTAFYALAFILPAGMWWSLRRLVRRRRGQCVACGYPKSQSAVCSECGKASADGGVTLVVQSSCRGS